MKKIIRLLVFFTSICFNPANAQTWQPIGTGTNDGVNVLCQYGSDLYAGGEFTIAGGQLAGYIAKWNGTSWTPLPLNVDGVVKDMIVFGGELYVTGTFAHAGTLTVNSIAKWNGTSWSALGTGLAFVSTIGEGYSLEVHNNLLYVGGFFTNAGSTSTSNIAKWDGSTWTALSLGINGFVFDLQSFNGELYAGGNYFDASGVANTANLSKWDGTNWTAVSSGVNGIVEALHTYNNELYIGGWFSTAGGVTVNKITKWNGTIFSQFGLGLSTSEVYTITDYNGDIYIGGSFNNVGGISCKKVAKWNGANWSPLGAGLSSTVRTLLPYNGELHAGGQFSDPDSLSSGYDHIAKWATNITGIERNFSDEKLLSIYPNPTKDLLTIQLSQTNTKNLNLKLINITGIVVLDIPISDLEQKTIVDLSNLSAGVYFMVASEGNKIATYKIIKN